MSDSQDVELAPASAFLTHRPDHSRYLTSSTDDTRLSEYETVHLMSGHESPSTPVPKVEDQSVKDQQLEDHATHDRYHAPFRAPRRRFQFWGKNGFLLRVVCMPLLAFGYLAVGWFARKHTFTLSNEYHTAKHACTSISHSPPAARS